MESITMRPALDNDATLARDIHHRAFREVVTAQFGEWDEALQDRFFNEMWAPEKFEIIEWEGTPCGYFRKDVHEGFVEIHEIGIDPEFQGKGIGSKVLRMTITLADHLKIPSELQVLHRNNAVSLYRRLGFAEIGRSETHIRMRRDCLLPGMAEI